MDGTDSARNRQDNEAQNRQVVNHELSTTATTEDEIPSSCQRFFRAFFLKASGPLPILAVGTLVSFCLGSTIGIVPSVVGDRYARLRYSYSGPDCTSFERLEKPEACQNGADDAQAAAAASVLAQNLLTLIFNPVVGSLSDVRGRRGAILVSLVLVCLGPSVFVLVQQIPAFPPFWYYAALSLSGAVDFLSMSFASLSDVLSEEIRTAGYGVLLAGFYGGFCLAPSLPLFMSHSQVTVFSAAAALAALFLALLALPETLPPEVARHNQQIQHHEQRQQRRALLRRNSGSSYSSGGSEDQSLFVPSEPISTEKHYDWFVRTVTSPLRDISILNRDNSFRLLAAGSFFSAMVYSSDKTFVVYYIENQLSVRDDDLAHMFLIFGSLGIIIQAFLLRPMLRVIGEKPLLVITFLSGTIHNALYGLARNKSTILAALCLSQLTKVDFPLLSSFASRGASANEQGRVQGALFALNALANAVGPMLLEVVYNHTKQNNQQSLLGPGTMFLCAACLYGIGTVLVSCLPRVQSITISDSGSLSSIEEDEEDCHISVARRDDFIEDQSALEQPLLLETRTDDSV